MSSYFPKNLVYGRWTHLATTRRQRSAVPVVLVPTLVRKLTPAVVRPELERPGRSRTGKEKQERVIEERAGPARQRSAAQQSKLRQHNSRICNIGTFLCIQ